VHSGILTEDDSLADRLERLFEQLVGITGENPETDSKIPLLGPSRLGP
jgi:hypothetical protein